jgi:hypothetical protein
MGDVMACEMVWSLNSEAAKRGTATTTGKVQPPRSQPAELSGDALHRPHYFFWLHILAPFPIVARSYCSGVM